MNTIKSDKAVQVNTYSGAHSQFYLTALGKTIMKHSRSRTEKVIERSDLTAKITNTIIGRKEL